MNVDNTELTSIPDNEDKQLYCVSRIGPPPPQKNFIEK